MMKKRLPARHHLMMKESVASVVAAVVSRNAHTIDTIMVNAAARTAVAVMVLAVIQVLAVTVDVATTDVATMDVATTAPAVSATSAVMIVIAETAEEEDVAGTIPAVSVIVPIAVVAMNVVRTLNAALAGYAN